MKEKLINIIARCNDPKVKRDWIIEMSNKTNIECSESECDGCIIATECIETFNNSYR